jgi:O-antigen/teichoic acid export membrane protein
MGAERSQTISLKSRTLSGVGWSGAGNVVRQLLQTVTLLVMAKFLAPQEFGLFATLAIFMNLAQLLGNMGTAQVIVHLDAPDDRMLSTLFYLNVGLGIANCTALYLIAGPIAYFYSEPRLAGLLQVLSVGFVFAGLGNVQRALMERSMQFKRVILLETTSLGASCLLGMGMAAAGYGIVSLIAMTLLNTALLSFGLFTLSDWRPKFLFANQDIRRVWEYTSHLTAFDMVSFLARNADAFLIGKFIGPGALGLYSLAGRVLLYPTENVSRVVVRVIFPAFAQFKNDNRRFADAYLNAVRFIAMLTFPAMAGLVAVADNLVGVAFDDRWSGLGTLIMILAPVGMVQSVLSSVGTIFHAKGTTRLLLKVGAINSGIAILAFAAGLPFGVNGVAILYALATTVVAYPTLKVSWAQIELGVGTGLRHLLPYFAASVLMAGLVWLAGRWMAQSGVPLPTVLAVQIAAGIVLYSSYLYFAHRQELARIFGELRQP